jgi:dihydroorotate dehydrogenase
MYNAARALLFQLDPERAHHLVLHNLSRWPALANVMVPRLQPPRQLEHTVLGLRFAHPIGLAAGLDKDGIAVPGLFNCGFSSIEVGTVTPRPQPGNPAPRLFRLKEDEALINRMGFNNAGADACSRNIHRIAKRTGPIGINIGKNKTTPNEQAIDDYEAALQQVVTVADYITVNLSSPNTPGLRDLQSASTISELLERLSGALTAHQKPVFVKLSPDLAEETLTDICQAVLKSPIRLQVGLIATNTTLSREGLRSQAQREMGGLSGRPLRERATKIIQQTHQACDGKLPIIGCGGIFDARDAYEKILAGASSLQIYTAFIYRGPGVVRQITQELGALLQADGFRSLEEAVGAGN